MIYCCNINIISLSYLIAVSRLHSKSILWWCSFLWITFDYSELSTNESTSKLILIWTNSVWTSNSFDLMKTKLMIIELKIWRIFSFTSSDMLIFLSWFSNSIKSERIKRCLWSISEQVNIDDHVLLSLVQCKLPDWIWFQADCVVNVSCLFVFLFFSRLAGLFLSVKMLRNCTLLLSEAACQL